jgi:flagellar biosynthetic protein FlhB
MSLSDQERTEAPTPRKRDEARKEGRVPRSAELATSFVLVAGALLLNVAGPWVGSQLVALFGYGLAAVGSAPLELESSVALVRSFGWRTLALLAAWGGGLVLIAIAVAGPQARGILTAKPLLPKMERMSPRQNVKRILGIQSSAELVKSLLKLVLIGFAVKSALGAAWDDLMMLSQAPAFGFVVLVKKYSVRLLLTSGLCYLGLAALDYAWQLWQHEKQLKMSREEIKQELKQTEGDPLVKQRMRSFGRALARRQMFRAVPTADVVITNPTHIAVALRYDPDEAPAPIVVAMGQRKVAERIKALAKENGVPCIENKPLARALLAGARVGSVIPAELYVAVAEILAFVIRRRVARGAPLREAYA